MDKQIKQELDGLLYLMLENEATPAQVDRLNELMRSSSAVCQYITDYYYIVAALRKGNSVVSASLGTECEVDEFHNLLNEMASYEKTAPVIEIPLEKSQSEFIHKPAYLPKEKRRISKFQLFTVIMGAAAMILFLLFVRFAPTKTSVKVAALVDQIDAQWANPQKNIENGSMFFNTDSPSALQKGVVEIEFDSGATVVIEGPSQFACISNNQIVLEYGRLYARVPSRAAGFTVETNNSRIVDIGTEFGVQANVDKSTELHVIKGITKLLAGSGKNKDVLTITKGQSREVSSDGKSVKSIALKEDSFVRQINSKTGLILRAQKTVDLADIVGGGNGFGTGRRNMGLNPVTGMMSEIHQEDVNRKVDNAYRNVSISPFIDGVFVPNGQVTQVISSSGHVFQQCPVTRGNCFTEISASPGMIDRAEIVLGGVNYSREDAGSLFLHANLGITYDLQAIRSQLKDMDITHFRSTIGVCESSWRPCNADFWILVDGRLRYSREKVQQKGVLDTVEIELSKKDRFLTLIATDGGDPEIRQFEGAGITSMDSDWCLFAEPVLVME